MEVYYQIGAVCKKEKKRRIIQDLRSYWFYMHGRQDWQVREREREKEDDGAVERERDDSDRSCSL